jgi:adenylate cyclase
VRCATCKCENPEHAKFCGDCGAALGPSAELIRCGTCSFLNRPSAKFCGGCGAPRQADASRPAPAQPAGERKIVTVLFSDVSGFTALSETLDPEELRDLMDGWFARLGDIVRRCGGTIDKFIGDAVMVLFGAPVAREDDPRRAIDAALQMHSALARYNEEIRDRIGRTLAIRIGINTGRVYAGMIGGEDNRAYTVMGDAVNIASRLEGACPVGSVLVSASTYRHVRGRYEVRALEPIAVKGKSDPIAAFEVLGAKAAAASLSVMSMQRTRTVGRDAEISTLADVVARAAEHATPSIVVVTGDHGMGKSAFLTDGVFEVAKRTQLGRLLSARCTANAGAGAFQVLSECLRNSADVPRGEFGRAAAERVDGYLRRVFEPDDADETIRVLSHAIGLSEAPLGPPASLTDPQTLHHQTLEAAHAWMRALARRGPVLVRVDNVHLAPDATADLCRHLLKQTLPLTIIASSRSEGPHLPERWRTMPHCVHLPLRPLDHAASLQVATAMLSRLQPPSPLLAERLAQRCAGNPSYIEETIRALLEQGVLAEDGARGTLRLTCGDRIPTPLPVPDTVGQMVQARVDRLTPGAKRALQWASVAGERFWPAMLAAVARVDAGYTLGVADIELALAEPLAAELIVEAGGQAPDGSAVFRFRQSLIRDIVYEGITVKHRRQWHEQIARWRLGETNAEDLEPAVLDSIAHHLVSAGDDAQAARLYRRAGDAARAVWANRDARDRYERARDCQARAGAPAADRVAVLEALGEVCASDGAYAAAIAAYDAALGFLGNTGDGAVAKARVLIQRGRSCTVGRDRARATASFEEAIAVLQRAGQRESARRLLASALQNLGWARYLEGAYDDAETLYEQGLAACVGIDAKLEQAALEDARGTIARVRGDLDAAIRGKRRALELRYEAGDQRKLATSYVNLGGVLIQSGEYEAAREALEQALRIHEQTGNAEGIGIACMNLGAAELELGVLPAATAHFERSVGVATHSGAWYAPMSYRYLAEAVMRAGDLARARTLVDDGLALAERGSPPEFRGTLLSVRGSICSHDGDAAAANAAFAEAIATLESTSSVFELGIALYRYGEMLRDSGDAAGGRVRIERAKDVFTSVGNVTWRARADETLASL